MVQFLEHQRLCRQQARVRPRVQQLLYDDLLPVDVRRLAR